MAVCAWRADGVRRLFRCAGRRPVAQGAGAAAVCTGSVRGGKRKTRPRCGRAGRSCAVFLRGVDGGDQDLLQLNAFVEYFCVAAVSAFDEQFDPIFGFGALFQGDLKLCNKIGFAVCIKSLSNVGTYACSGTQKLMDQGTFALCGSQLFTRPDDDQRKRFRFGDQRAVIHGDPPFRPMITHAHENVKNTVLGKKEE